MLSEEVLCKMESYISNPFGFVLFSGKQGLGKTYCALRVYEKLASYKLPFYDHDEAWFISQSDLNILWNKNMATLGHAYEIVEDIFRTKLLIIDDLGTRVPSESFMDFLYSIVDKRYAARDHKGTIITTNLSSEKIRERFGDSFLSRMASGLIYQFSGKDRRFTEKGL